MRLVLNASPIICLAKAGLLEEVLSTAQEVVVPRPVASEILAVDDDRDAAVAWMRTEKAQRALCDVEPPAPFVLAWDLGVGESAVLTAVAGSPGSVAVLDEGTDRERLEKMATPNVKFLGRVSEAEIERELAGCRAFIFPGEEDFGITPVEAQACGKPVIAFAAGGALETVIDGVTGVFFKDGNAESLRAALLESEKITWDPHAIRKKAERFSEEQFLKNMVGFMEERIGERSSP